MNKNGKIETIKTIKMKWGWRAQMASLILFIEMGDNSNRTFAKKQLMLLADKLDENNISSEELNK